MEPNTGTVPYKWFRFSENRGSNRTGEITKMNPNKRIQKYHLICYQLGCPNFLPINEKFTQTARHADWVCIYSPKNGGDLEETISPETPLISSNSAWPISIPIFSHQDSMGRNQYTIKDIQNPKSGLYLH